MQKRSAATQLFILEPGFISLFQAIILYISVVLSTIDIFAPHLTAERSGRDGWISVLFTYLMAVPVAATGLALAFRFPRRSLIEYLQMVFGVWPGRVVGFVYLFFFLAVVSTISRELEEIMSIAFFQYTPSVMFSVTAVLLSAYLIYNGAEVIGRINEVIFPLGMIILGLVFLLILPRADFMRYLPVLENGIKVPLRSSFTLLGFLAEGVIMLYVFPLMVRARPKKIVTGVSFAVSFIILALLAGTIAIPVLGLHSVTRSLMPALEVARHIEIPGLPRPDILIMTGWYAGIFIKISVIYYVLVVLTAQLLGMSSYKPLVLPYGVIIVSLSSLMFASTQELAHSIGGSITYFLLTFEFVLPLIILIVAWLRGVEEKEKILS